MQHPGEYAVRAALEPHRPDRAVTSEINQRAAAVLFGIGQPSEKVLAASALRSRAAVADHAVQPPRLAHPPRVHLPHLGEGEGFSTLESFLQKLRGRSCHISHLSHHCFECSGKRLVPAARKAARLLDKYENVTFDTAPISFGGAVIFTAEAELSGRIASATGKKSIGHPASPYRAVWYEYQKERYIDSLLWINGMELLLYIEDLSKVSLSVDFPSGGKVESYPFIIACLMDREKRNAFLNTLNPDAAKTSTLRSLEREYSLYEIARITRSSPAAACALNNRGSLREGAIADIVLYEPRTDIEKMFANPRHVIIGGRPVTAAGLL